MRYIYIIILIVLFNDSCTNWLDEKPDIKQVVPVTLKDFKALMDNADDLTTSCPGLHEISSDAFYLVPSAYQSRTEPERNAYIWGHEFPYVDIIDWNNAFSTSSSYRKVYISNLVLQGLDKIRPKRAEDIQLLNTIKGEALFLRGKTFFELSQVFSPPLDQNSENTRYGIPLPLEADVNIIPDRSTVKATYEQIIDDLLRSLELLPKVTLKKTKPSKAAAYAMLARIYLSIESYENANKYADLSLSEQSSLIDFNRLDSVSNNPIQRFGEEVIYHSTMVNYGIFSTARLIIDSNLYKSYHDDDLRKSRFFIKTSTGNISFKGSYDGSARLFNGLSVDEMYLTRAECLAREGRTDEAMKDLNTLLQSRWRKDKYIDISAANPDEALSLVLTERKKELILRGLRWSDLRRLNRDIRFMTTIIRVIDNVSYTLQPGSYKYTFPIPDDIVRTSKIIQNPGW